MMARLGYVGTQVPDREIIYALPGMRRSRWLASTPTTRSRSNCTRRSPSRCRFARWTSRRGSDPTHQKFGVNAYPSIAALLLHCLLRAASNMRAHVLRQIQLHDIAMVTRRMGPADWAAFLEKQHGRGTMVDVSAARAHGSLLRVLRALHSTVRASRCLSSRVARRERAGPLTDVSWSNMRISAFPGIAWSRTVSDVVWLCAQPRAAASPRACGDRRCRRAATAAQSRAPGISCRMESGSRAGCCHVRRASKH